MANDHPLSSKLKVLAPEITISKKASISPASGASQDFSAGSEIQYTVTAEDGNTKTYKASVVVLPARGNLESDSIYIHGTKVTGTTVTVGKDISTVTLKDIQVNFKGEYTPPISSINPKTVVLNKRGDSAVITLSTKKTDRWNVWNSPNITVKRAKDDSDIPPSSACDILKFSIGDSEGQIEANNNRIVCYAEDVDDVGDDMLKNLAPTIICSPGAMVMPGSGVARDFSNSATVSVQYTVKAENGATKIYNVLVLRSKKIAKIRTFKVGNYSAKIDHESLKIELELPSSAKLSMLNPIITLSRGATCNHVSGAQENFTDSVQHPVEYIVTSEDTTVTKTYKVTVTRRKSREALIEKFTLAGMNGVIVHGDKTNSGTIKVEVADGTPLNQMTPTITYSDHASIDPASGTPQDFSKPVTYTVTSENKKTINKYIVTVLYKTSDKAMIEEFSVDGNAGVINHGATNTDGTIRVEVPEDKQLDRITPTIKISLGATIMPGIGQQQDFRNPVAYTVTAQDKKTKKKYVVTVAHKATNKALITSFKINGKICNIDHGTEGGNGAITLEVEKNTDLSNITPEIEISEGATITPGKGEAQNFETPVTYTVKSKDQAVTKQYIVTITKKKSRTARMTSFTANGKSATINENEKTIYLHLPFATQLGDIKPAIVCEDGGTCTPASDAKCDFSGGKTVSFKVTSEDGKVNVTYVATIKREPPETTITIFEVEAQKVSQGNMKVEIPKEKNNIAKSDIKITYMEGNETKSIEEGKFEIEGEQGTLQVESGSMTLIIKLNLGVEFISNASMEIAVTKKQG